MSDLEEEEAERATLASQTWTMAGETVQMMADNHYQSRETISDSDSPSSWSSCVHVIMFDVIVFLTDCDLIRYIIQGITTFFVI